MTEEPAFPFVSSEERIREDGMSLRDYFAGQALPGVFDHYRELYKASPENFAEKAYEIADAMIQEREATDND